MQDSGKFWLGFWALVLITNLVGFVANDKLNRWAAQNQTATEVVLGFHLVSFMTSGGGPLGPQTNYFAWSYTKRLQEPRPWWHHALFPESILYQPFGYWMPPAEEWPYPGLEPRLTG